MNYRENKFSRRELIKYMAFGATTPFIWGLTNKTEASKASKEQVKYQDKPNKNEKCNNCVQFIPGETQDAKGECKVVQGSVSPQGWCTLFTQKS